MSCNKVRGNFGPSPYGVIGGYIAVPSYDTIHIGNLAHMAYNVVALEFKVAFYTFLGAFSLVARHVVCDFASRSGNPCSGLFLSISSIHRQIC